MLVDGGDELPVLLQRPVGLAAARAVLVLGRTRLVDSGVGSLEFDDRGLGLVVELVDRGPQRRRHSQRRLRQGSLGTGLNLLKFICSIVIRGGQAGR